MVVQGAEAAGLTTSDESRSFGAGLEVAAHIGGFSASAQLVLMTGRKSVDTADC
jgi:hypothetical protein